MPGPYRAAISHVPLEKLLPIPQLHSLIGFPIPLQIPLLDLHAVFCAASLDVGVRSPFTPRVQIGGQVVPSS